MKEGFIQKKKTVTKQKPTITKKATPQVTAKINVQKQKYEEARKNNDYLGMRIANTEANKVREKAKLPLYSSAVGDKQASLTNAKNLTGLKQNISNQMASNANKKVANLSANHPLNRESKTVSPIPTKTLKDMFDKNENYVDKFKKGNIKGGVASLVGETIQMPQSALMNISNNINSVTHGKGLQPYKRMMDYPDYEKQIESRNNVKPLSKLISDKNKTLGNLYSVGMDVVTDPLNLLDVGAAQTAKQLKALGSAKYADNLANGKLVPTGGTPARNTVTSIGGSTEAAKPRLTQFKDKDTYINEIVDELGARNNPRNLTTSDMKVRDNEIAQELDKVANMTDSEFRQYARQNKITRGQLPQLHKAKEVKPLPGNSNVIDAAQEPKNALNQKASKPLDLEILRERLNLPKKNTVSLNVGTPVINLERGNKGTIAKDMGDGNYLVLFENKSTGGQALIKMNSSQFTTQEQVISDLNYKKALNKANMQIKSPSRTNGAINTENKAVEQVLPNNGTSVAKTNKIPPQTNLKGQNLADKVMTRKDKNFEEKYNAFINDEGYEAPQGNTGVGDWVGNIKPKGVGISKDLTRNAESALDGEGLSWFKKNFADNFYKSKGENAKNIKEKTDLIYNEVVKKRGIKKGTKESTAIQWYGEGQKMIGSEAKPYTLADLQEEFGYKMPNGKYAWQNIVESNNIMRRMYDDYVNGMNEALRKIYPNVEQTVAKMQAKKAGKSLEEMAQIDRDIDRYTTGKRLYPRKDYYHHFQELQDGFFSTLDNVLNSATNIDPKLVGVSEFTKPKSKFMGALQHRSKDATYKADALEGMLQYIPQAEYKINIEPNIPALRNMIKDLKDYTGGNANQFIDYLMKFTNDLAGKTNDLDRIPLKVFGDENGRKVLNTLSTVSNRIRANAVVGNVNTLLAQFFNMPNVVGYAKNPIDVAQGMFEASKANLGDKTARQILDKSDFLRERYLDRSIRRFNTGVLNNAENFLSWTMEIGDKAVADSAFMTFYKQGIKNGMPDAEAVKYADNLTRKSVAGRGIGELPLAQKAKVTKLIAPFQVEVQNAYNVLKELGSEKQITPILEIFATTWIMNNALEKISGRRIGFDPVDVLLDSYKNEDNETPTDNAKSTVARMGGEALSNAPFGSYIGETLADSLGLSEYEKQSFFGEADPTRFGTGNIAIQTLGAPIGSAVKQVFNSNNRSNIDLLKPAMAILPKFGGKQIERSVRGLQDMAVIPKETVNLGGMSVKKQDFPASFSSSGRLRFALEPSKENFIKSSTLGTWATDEGKGYVKDKLKPLGDKQTQFVKTANKKGLPAIQSEEIVRSFKGLKQKAQREKILDLPISAKQKQIVGDYVDSKLKEPRDYSSQENYDFSVLAKETRQKFGLTKNTNKDAFTKAYLAQKDIDSSVDKAYAVLENGNEETAKALGISEHAIESAKQMKAAGLRDFNTYKKSADTDGNNSVKKDEAINMLENTNLTREQKRALFKALCPNVKSNPY
ncbi:MAG: hypothetical protein AB9836_05925 [Aminipila sp.]